MSVLYSNRFPISLEIGQNFVTAHAGFDYKDTVKQCGFKWNNDARKWQMPTDKFRQIAAGIASRLTIDPVMFDEWLTGKKWRSKFQPKAEIVPNPRRYSYQNDAIKHAIFHKYSIMGLTMGMGKSCVGCGIIESAYPFPWDRRPSLVLCPAFLKLNWVDEIKKWLPPHFAPFVVEGKTPAVDIENASKNPFTIFILNYEIIQNHPHVFHNSGVWIVDESQALKNPEANRTKNFLAYINQGRPEFLTLMSGTAATNSIADFFTQLAFCAAGSSCAENVLKNPQWSSWLRFAKYFAHERETKFGTKYIGIKNWPQLRELLDGNYLRQSADEFLDLPPIVRQRFTVNADPKLLAENDMGLMAAWDKMQGKPTDQQTEAAITAAKRGTAKLKATGTIALAESILENPDAQVVIFSDHRDAAEFIAKALKADLIWGDTPNARRHAYIEKFQAGEKRAIVCTIGAAKTGITLTAANQMIFNDLPWVPGDYLQAEKRIHRIGQTERCVIHIATAPGLDTMIGNTILRKARDLTLALGLGNETAVDF